VGVDQSIRAVVLVVGEVGFDSAEHCGPLLAFEGFHAIWHDGAGEEQVVTRPQPDKPFLHLRLRLGAIVGVQSCEVMHPRLILRIESVVQKAVVICEISFRNLTISRNPTTAHTAA